MKQHGVEIIDERGCKPIHWAVMTRRHELVEWLLQQGADINAMRPDGARHLDLTNGDYWYRGWRKPELEARVDHWVVMDHLLGKGA